MTEEERQEIIEVANITPADESPEQIQKRIEFEEYQRRNLQAIKDREDVYRRNGLLKPGEQFVMDPTSSPYCCNR